MRIDPLLAVLMLLGFIFYPSIERWGMDGGSMWYRPFAVWLLFIAIAGWHNHYRIVKTAQADNDEGSF